MQWEKKDLVGISELSAEEISLILDTAESFTEISRREIKKVPTLRGKTVINFFHEPSTRTRTSFEIAGKRLSADTVNISVSGSSLVKGETLNDMAANLGAMAPDALVIRHAVPGVPHSLAKLVDFSVINAGDGAHEHPTQALLDMLTIRQKFGKLKGVKVSIVGDIAHSRVARSNIIGLLKMGAEVTVAGPPTLLPRCLETLGVKSASSPEDAIRGRQVLMALRIQRERQGKQLLPSLREYSKMWGITLQRLRVARRDLVVMHPGPINRGVEIDPEVADGPFSVILEQVANGVAVRMALLYLLIGRGRKADDVAD